MMGIPLDGPAWLLGDNQSIVTSSTLPHLVLSKQHNALVFHRVRKAIALGIMHLLWIEGKDNASNVLTKPLSHAVAWPLIQPLFFWKCQTISPTHSVSSTSQWGVSTPMLVLSTGSRNGAHYLSHDTQGKPVKTNLVCLPTNPDTDGFGQVQSQLSIQKHDVTVLGLNCCHAKEHGNYDECAHSAVYNTVETNEMDHNGAWQIVGPKWKVNRFALL
jgi:hypothetical protein